MSDEDKKELNVGKKPIGLRKQQLFRKEPDPCRTGVQPAAVEVVIIVTVVEISFSGKSMQVLYSENCSRLQRS